MTFCPVFAMVTWREVLLPVLDRVLWCNWPFPEDEAARIAQEAGQRANSGDGENWGLIIFWGIHSDLLCHHPDVFQSQRQAISPRFRASW